MKGRVACKYGAKCYRKNPDHLREYAHPGDEDVVSPASTSPLKKSGKLLSTLVLGAPSAWVYRKSGKTKVHNFRLGNDGEDEGPVVAFTETGGPFLLSVACPAALHALKDVLQHGDVLDFGDYRGCFAFIVEPLTVARSDFILHKTLEEMGYGVPVNFSDAPVQYFCETEQYYRFFHSDFAHPTKSAFFWEEVAARKEEPDFESDNDFSVEPKTVDLAHFPDGYVYYLDFLNNSSENGEGGSWLTKSTYTSQEYHRGNDWKFYLERKEYRRRNSVNLRVTQAVVTMILTKAGLIKDVCGIIAKFVCSPPYVGEFSAATVAALAPKSPSKKKSKKKDSDDDEWKE